MMLAIHLDMLKYQNESLFYNTVITNVFSTYSQHDTPVNIKKMTNDIQSINPTQITDQYIMVDKAIELVNRNFEL